MSALSRTRGRTILIVSILLTVVWLTFVDDALNAAYVSVTTARDYASAGELFFSAHARSADPVFGQFVGILSVELVALVVAAALTLLGASWSSRGKSKQLYRSGASEISDL
jgi:hypothetical protein